MSFKRALSKLTKYVPSPIPNFAGAVPAHHSQGHHSREAVEVKPLNRLGIHLGEHWGIVGVTGSGKSVFAQQLLEYLRRQFPHAKRYVLDSTEDGMDGIKIGRLEVRGNHVPDLLRDAAHTQIWIPDTDDRKAYNTWFEKILYAREPAIVLVDELASLGDELEGHIKLLKQGRKHDITVINETQEIARVTPTVFRQMAHFVQFRINAETYDMAMARKYLDISKDEQRMPRHQYGFFHRKTSKPMGAVEYVNAQTFFKNAS